MSLKSFHIVFILASIVLAAGFGLWCFLTEEGSSLAGANAMATISLVAAAGLLFYLVKFPSKMQDIE